MEFAKKTGDIRELSRTDLLVLALTYMLEVESNGLKHVRTEPVGVPLSMMDVIDEPDVKPSAAPAPTVPEVEESAHAPTDGPADEAAPAEATAEAGDDDGWTEVRHTKPAPAKKTARRRRGGGGGAVVSDAVPKPVPALPSVTTPSEAAPASSVIVEGACEGVEEEDDGEGEWFGPGMASAGGGTGWDIGTNADGSPRIPVGCITTDFAMQVCACVYVRGRG